MTTPNLDATGHWWVGALARFNFQLKYLKGCDNTMADVLSWISTHLNPDMVRLVLDGITLGATQKVECHDPTVVGGDHDMEKEVYVTAGQVLVQMHVTDWAEAQGEDSVLSMVLEWLEAQKKTDLKTLFRSMPPVRRAGLILQNHQNFMIHQKALYLCSMPKGKNEDLLLFMVPKVHQITTLNGCHRDTGHQGHNHTLSLLQECFWWPGMTSQMRQSIRTCVHCLQHEGSLSKAPLHPIMATAPLDLLHVDFTSIETTLELNQSPRVANILVFQDHFTKHVLAYVTPNQTAKTITKYLYQGYISIFGVLARLLSDRGANFISSVIDEMCKILSVKKLQTMPYHPHTNGLVERLHQTIMRMIGKLGKDKKADWPRHLAEIVHPYNATHSAVTGYSLHYLMFGWRPRLPVDFYFLTFRSTEAPMREASTKHVDQYIVSVWDQLRTALQEAQTQSTAEAHQQQWYFDHKIGTVNLKPGNLVLVKANAFKGKRKIWDRWEEETCEVVHQIVTDIPSYEVMDQHRWSHILHWNWLLLITSEIGIPLCKGVCHAWDRCASPTPHKPTSKGSEDVMMLQESSGQAVTQCLASKTSLVWINGKLWLLPWTSAEASTEDGWRLQVMCSGCRHWKEHVHLAKGMMLLPADAIRWWTPWLTQLLTELGHGLQDQKGGIMDWYPSMSGGWMSWHLPPWHRVLPPTWRGTLAAGRKVALYPHYTKQEVLTSNTKARTKWKPELDDSQGMRTCP